MKTVLFSRPNHDDVTSYLNLYSKSLVENSKRRGFKCLDKEGEKANKKEIISILEIKKPCLVMFNGHGTPTAICGHKNEIIIKAIENSALLKNIIVYSLSCSSALELGPKCVTEGTKAFIGYEDEFALGMDTNYQATPLKDKRARMFLEPSNRLFEALLKGNKVKIAIDKSKKLTKRNISLLKTDSSPEAAYYIPYLFSNYLSLIVHGDEEVSIN